MFKLRKTHESMVRIHVLYLTVMIAVISINYANGLSTTGDRGKWMQFFSIR